MTNYEFNAGPPLASLKSQLTDHESIIKIDQFVKVTGKTKQDLLDFLSELLCRTDSTQTVATCFEPILLELLFRASKREDKPTFFCTLSKLVGYHSCATQFWYDYFKQEQLFQLPLPSKTSEGDRKLKKTKIGASKEDILTACLSYLWLNTAWFSDLCNWSVLYDYIEDTDLNVRWLANECIRLISNTSESDFNAGICQLFTSEEIVQLRFNHSDIFRTRLRKVPSQELATNTSSTILIKESDLCPGIVSVCGVLLNKIVNDRPNNRLKNVVRVPTFEKCLRMLAVSVAASEPVIIEGVVGSGKTSLVEYLAARTGRTTAPELMKVQLGDQIDSKLLIGSHCCTEIPGDFIWRAGPLTQAMMNGHWLLFEDIDCASPDVITILTAAIKTRSLSSLPGAFVTGSAHGDFRVFFTRRLIGNHAEFVNRNAQNELDKFCNKISIDSLIDSEIQQVVTTNWPKLQPIEPKILEIFRTLTDKSNDFDENRAGTTRQVSLRDLVKFCTRLSKYLVIDDEKSANYAFLDGSDCFYQCYSDRNSRVSRGIALGGFVNITKAEAENLILNHKPDVIVSNSTFSVGRATVDRQIKMTLTREVKSCFAHTQQSTALLERICVSVIEHEPVLLVGETGTGKTSTVQYLAESLGHKLIVVNMNQQSDSSDLLGGYKPVDFSAIALPIRREFEELFTITYQSNERNLKYLNYITQQFNAKKYDEMFQLMLHPYKKDPSKAKGDMHKRWEDFVHRIEELRTKCLLDEKRYQVAFAYVEGSLVRAMRAGHWLLLDEINLAEAETLQCLSSVLDSDYGSVMLLDKADGKPVECHNDFRLFACMNPATDVGKKELPLGIRNRFSEFFVDEIESRSDLQVLVSSYVGKLGVSKKQIKSIIDFYLEVRKQSNVVLSDTTGHKPHFSLR